MSYRVTASLTQRLGKLWNSDINKSQIPSDLSTSNLLYQQGSRTHFLGFHQWGSHVSASEKQHTGQPPRGWQVQATLSIPHLRALCLCSPVLRAVLRLCQAPRIFRGLRTVGESTFRGRRFRQDLGLLSHPYPHHSTLGVPGTQPGAVAPTSSLCIQSTHLHTINHQSNERFKSMLFTLPIDSTSL